MLVATVLHLPSQGHRLLVLAVAVVHVLMLEPQEPVALAEVGLAVLLLLPLRSLARLTQAVAVVAVVERAPPYLARQAVQES